MFCPFELIESQIFESNQTNFEWIPIWLHPYETPCKPVLSIFSKSPTEYQNDTLYCSKSLNLRAKEMGGNVCYYVSEMVILHGDGYCHFIFTRFFLWKHLQEEMLPKMFLEEMTYVSFPVETCFHVRILNDLKLGCQLQIILLYNLVTYSHFSL